MPFITCSFLSCSLSCKTLKVKCLKAAQGFYDVWILKAKAYSPFSELCLNNHFKNKVSVKGVFTITQVRKSWGLRVARDPEPEGCMILSAILWDSVPGTGGLRCLPCLHNWAGESVTQFRNQLCGTHLDLFHTLPGLELGRSTGKP